MLRTLALILFASTRTVVPTPDWDAVIVKSVYEGHDGGMRCLDAPSGRPEVEPAAPLTYCLQWCNFTLPRDSAAGWFCEQIVRDATLDWSIDPPTLAAGECGTAHIEVQAPLSPIGPPIENEATYRARPCRDDGSSEPGWPLQRDKDRASILLVEPAPPPPPPPPPAEIPTVGHLGLLLLAVLLGAAGWRLLRA